MNTKTNYDVTDARLVAKELSAAVGTELHSIILFGSAAYGPGHDLDMIIVLRDEADFTATLPLVRSVLTSFDWPIDAHIIRVSETARRPFCLNTQGTYLLPILQSAVVLFGDNPFADIHATKEELAADAMRKVQHYVFRMRQAAVGCNRTEKPDEERWIKFLRKCTYDILAVHGTSISFREAPTAFAARWPDVISPNETDSLNSPTNATLENVLPLLERLYAAAPRLLNPQTI